MTDFLRMTPKRIIVHHSLTEDGDTVSWSAIRRYHMVEKGWIDIGYHAGCERVGKVYECLVGRPWDEIGAHTTGQNINTLGFCFVGNFDNGQPPWEQLTVGAKVISAWMRLFKIPVEAIYPHSHYAAKSCPGKRFPMDKLKAMLEA